MTFRPQFSLRTLLLVTALIAVGAKLWHGPYHVVETIDGVELEYDYYRGFGWERVKHGVVIERHLGQGSFRVADSFSHLRLFRHGEDTKHICSLYANPDSEMHFKTSIFKLFGLKIIFIKIIKSFLTMSFKFFKL